jgi:hypothetical protein
MTVIAALLRATWHEIEGWGNDVAGDHFHTRKK